MTGPGYDPEIPPNPRLLHTALLAGTLFVLPLLYALRWVYPVDVAAGFAKTLRVIAYGFLLLQIVVVRILGGKIGPLRDEATEADWWARYTIPAVLIWLIGAALCLLSAAVHFLTDDHLLLFVGAGGIVLLVLARPSRLMRG